MVTERREKRQERRKGRGILGLFEKAKKRADEERAENQAILDAKEQELRDAKRKRNTIFISAGVVALIGAGIIIYKTRKK